jgi:opacity protein-like surface antigen
MDKRMTMKRIVSCGWARTVFGAALLVGGSLPALAQGYYYGPGGPGPYNPLHFYVEGGSTITTGQTSNYLDNGWNLGGGVQWRPAPGPFSLRLDLNYSRNDASNQLLDEGSAADQTRIDDGWSDIFTFDVDGVLDIPLGRGIKAYVMAGGGGAYRRISLTRTVGFRGYYCDDWYGFCESGFYPGDRIVDRNSTTRWEWNAGAGVNFPLPNGQSWFVEARYTQMQTPVPTSFIPIRVGYRF